MTGPPAAAAGAPGAPAAAPSDADKYVAGKDGERRMKGRTITVPVVTGTCAFYLGKKVGSRGGAVLRLAADVHERETGHGVANLARPHIAASAMLQQRACACMAKVFTVCCYS